jgi:hypothetical protein
LPALAHMQVTESPLFLPIGWMLVIAVLALVLLEIAIDWSGAKGAAVTMLGSSLLAVMGFYIAILNLAQIRIVVAPESEGGEPQPAPSPKN